jgi:hypothetical protein
MNTLCRHATRLIAVATLLSVVLMGSSALASFQSEGYSGPTLKPGLIVGIDPANTQNIQLASLQNSNLEIGVTESPEQSLIVQSGVESKVTVATTGNVYVYVSDGNGAIKRGDLVGLSYVEGIGMKVDTSQNPKVIGVALDDFDTVRAKEYGKVETATGNKNVKVDPIRIRLSQYEASSQAANSNSLQSFLSRLAGKDVSLVRVYLSLILFIATLTISGVYVSTSLHASFISIGRNPLASKAIARGLVGISGLTVAILVIGAALSYVVLRV